MTPQRTPLKLSHQIDETIKTLPQTLRDRMRVAVGSATCREVGLRTKTHPETVRRYLGTGTASVEFIRALIQSYGLSADWLLFGTGCVKRSEVLENTLRSATLNELMRAVGEKLSRVEDTIPAPRGAKQPGNRNSANASPRRTRENAHAHT